MWLSFTEKLDIRETFYRKHISLHAYIPFHFAFVKELLKVHTPCATNRSHVRMCHRNWLWAAVKRLFASVIVLNSLLSSYQVDKTFIELTALPDTSRDCSVCCTVQSDQCRKHGWLHCAVRPVETVVTVQSDPSRQQSPWSRTSQDSSHRAARPLVTAVLAAPCSRTSQDSSVGCTVQPDQSRQQCWLHRARPDSGYVCSTVLARSQRNVTHTDTLNSINHSHNSHRCWGPRDFAVTYETMVLIRFRCLGLWNFAVTYESVLLIRCRCWGLTDFAVTHESVLLIRCRCWGLWNFAVLMRCRCIKNK